MCALFAQNGTRLCEERSDTLLLRLRLPRAQAQGVECVYDNAHVAARSEVLPLCSPLCSPSLRSAALPTHMREATAPT